MQNSRIDSLRQQIKAEEERIRKCEHRFMEVKYDPETVREPYYTTEVHGSDVWQSVSGYNQKQVDRWSKECSVCGHVVYAYKQKPVISSYEPDFGNK